MKTYGWVVGVCVMGLVACGPSSSDEGDGFTEPPGTRAEAVRAVAADNCDNYANCGEVGPGKGYSDRASCLTMRERFWNDKWPADRCGASLDAPKLQACREGVRTISCKNLIDELRTINAVCDPADVCGTP